MASTYQERARGGLSWVQNDECPQNKLWPTVVALCNLVRVFLRRIGGKLRRTEPKGFGNWGHVPSTNDGGHGCLKQVEGDPHNPRVVSCRGIPKQEWLPFGSL